LGFVLCGLFALGAWGTPRTLESAEPVDYLRDVKPILARKCTSCHGALKQKAQLRLDAASLILKGGDQGPAVEPGKAAESLLIDAVTGANGVQRMPLDGEPLSDAEIATLKAWIDQGARAPDEAIPQDPRQHWAFQKPQRPPVPVVQDPEWNGNAIDAFVAAEHAKRGLTPQPIADKRTLLRRVFLDLIGLPPTRAEMQEFLRDDSPDAYQKVVDRLLASAHYGERWGRHWMDVWRYSDWDGYGAEVRESQPHIWRWRDWIIESLNADKPYDRMLVEMLAADEVAPEDPDTLRASGFLARNWFKFNRHIWLDNTVEHTGKAFLGVTLNCARCHDHMYDPIAQADYYRFRAFFEPYDVRTDRVPGQPDLAKDGLARVYDAKADVPTYLFHRGDDKQPDKDHPLNPGVPHALGNADLKFEPVALAPAAYYPGSQPFVQAETLAQAQADVSKAASTLETAQQTLAAARKKMNEFAAAKTAGTLPAKEEPAAFLADDFAAAKPEIWKLGLGKWDYTNGRLVQSESRDGMCQISTLRPHPADFTAKFKFKITGGKMWKSVGFSFDAAEDREFVGIYLSANAPGPKLQLFLRQAGQDTYPTEGAKSLPIELNRDYELQVAVRGALVNILVDGQLQIAYRLPRPRPSEGRFALWTYDATAEFVKIDVAPLAAGVQLAEKVGGEPVPATASPEAALAAALKQAEGVAALAERTLASSAANLASVEKRIAADQANFAVPPAPNAKELSLAAGQAEREFKLRQAEQNLVAVEQKLAAARETRKPDDEKSKKAVADAEAALTQATKARDDAQAALAKPSENYTRFGLVYPTQSTGRRTALARWITARDNPLTARVVVNHIWLRHFGQPLVPTVFDFGLNGKPPSHPELLDWLAVEFMESGWKMKSLHRLIVTSRAYQLQSTSGPADAANVAADPENRYLWRANVRRMEAEIVRDSTLYTAGQLDQTMAGPELDQNAGLTVARRSIYFRSAKEKKMTFLALFDSANPVECYRRSESIVPQQALAMANSPLTLAQARVLATSLSAEAGGDPQPEKITAFINAAFEQILCRPATAEEQAACTKFLADQTERFAAGKDLTVFTAGTASAVKPAASPHQRARENLVHVLLNHNDFLTVR
jgi:hypothetical protein